MSDIGDLYRPSIVKTVINRGFFDGNIVCFPQDIIEVPENLLACVKYLFGPRVVIEVDSRFPKPSIAIKNANFGLFDSESCNADTNIHFANEVLR